MPSKGEARRQLERRQQLKELRRRAAQQPWEPVGRPPLLPHQQPPEGDWDLWVLLAGRGAGKTEACSRYFARWMRQHPGGRGRVIAPTFGDAVESCITGPSGLQAIDPDVTWHPSAPGGAKVQWPNGAEALVIGTHSPRDVERLRAGGNRSIDWWEELAANPQLQAAWTQAELGLRLGEYPHSIASTTPRAIRFFRELVARDTTAITRATSRDNPHLSEGWRRKLEAAYVGTRMGRQEIEGELLVDVEGALWTWGMLARCSTEDYPDLVRVVVAVDPSGGSTDANDEQGIIVVGLGVDGEAYTLDDRSCRLSPDGWGRRTVQAYLDWEADAVLWEPNYGGDMAKATILAAARALGAEVPTKKVVASRGKQLRAQPVAALYGDPDNADIAARVHHLPGLTRLEEQMTEWTPESGNSPDRLDALVMAVTDLMLGRRSRGAALSWS